MKVHLLYREFNLGSLEASPNGFVWTPNLSNITEASKKYIGMDMFLLEKEPTLYKIIPWHYKDFLINADRPDLKQKANIQNSDSDFEKLYKLSKLNFFSSEFIIKS